MCRADQDTEMLESYWENITKIPRNQFYKTRVDPRTASKPSRKAGYKRVCRIDYFSAEIYHDIMTLTQIIAQH